MKILLTNKFISTAILSLFIILPCSYSSGTTSFISYPKDEWKTSTPEEQGMQSHVLAEMMENIQTENHPIDSLSIVRNEHMVLCDVPENLKLEDFGPDYYGQDTHGAASDIKVVSNKETTLKCGTKAYQTKITYLWYNFPVTTYLVSAYKAGKCIFVATHTWTHLIDVEPFVQSLQM